MDGELYIDKEKAYERRFPMTETTSSVFNAIAIGEDGHLLKVNNVRLSFDKPLNCESVFNFNLWLSICNSYGSANGTVLSRGFGESDEQLFKAGFYKVIELREVTTVVSERPTLYKLPLPNNATLA